MRLRRTGLYDGTKGAGRLSTTLARGHAAEDAVAAYLERRGCHVLTRNFRGRRGEIDLIVRDGAELAFVEVKARRAGTQSSLHAVDRRKKRRIVSAALEYITRRRLHGVTVRFDVAAVGLLPDGRPQRVTYVRHAFAADGDSGRRSL